jgi:signal transduction histidine kinase
MISRSGALRLEYAHEGDVWAEPEANAALQIYRVVQELVNNAIKHANAKWMRLTTHIHDNRHCISISHNGTGLTDSEYQSQLSKKDGIGLKNIENRIKASNLLLILPKGKEEVYTVTVCLPG